MAWRDQLHQLTLPDGRALVAGSFRGVAFRTVDAEIKVGRRNVVHEYPQRDLPYVDDLGRRARRYPIEAYVIGDNYLAERDALLTAFETPGAGELVHPRYGFLQVAVDGDVSVKESPDRGGMARVSVTFVENGLNTFPQAVENTVSKVEATANAADETAETDFAAEFSVEGTSVLAENAINGMTKSVGGLLDTARQATSVDGLARVVELTGGLTGNLAGLIRTPVVLVQSLRSIYAQLVQELQRPVAAFSELQFVFASNPRSSFTGMNGSSQARSVGNDNARADLARRLSLSNQARVLAVAITSAQQLATADQAAALSAALLGQIDIELEINDPPAELAAALTNLRAAVVRDVAERAEFLLKRSTYTPQTVLPALLLAHRIYLDPERWEELADRNAVRNPAFMPARALEILL